MSKREPPLDSPEWVPLAVVIKLWGERNASLELGEADTIRALREGKVRGMRRALGGEPERELVPPEFWNDRDREILYDADEVFLADTPGRFFCWQPDLERLLGAETKPKPQPLRPAAEEQARQGAPLKNDWIAITAEIAFREATATKKQREKSVLAEAKSVRAWCVKQLKQRPSISELRAAVNVVRRRFRGPT